MFYALWKKHPNIKRVVLTSSMVAVAFNGKLPSTHVYTEADWSDIEYLRSGKQWYNLSKTLAEQAALDFMKNAKAKFSLVVINPALIIGPMLQKSLNASSEVILKYLNGTEKVIQQSVMIFIDVRDAAELHVLAFENPSASGRFNMVQSSLPWEKFCNVLRKTTKGKNYAIPTELAKGDPPKPMLFDCSKATKLLGRPFRPLAETVSDTVKSMEEHGFLNEMKP